MKKSKLSLVLLSLLCSMNLVASKPETSEQLLKNEIQNLIGPFPHKISLEEDLITSVEFEINKNNEIVVINIKSKNDAVVDYVRTRLNYKRLKVRSNHVKNKFNLPIRFQGRL